jgi:hypothetical protein
MLRTLSATNHHDISSTASSVQRGYCDVKFVLLDTNVELELQVDYCCFLKEWQPALDSIIEIHTTTD